MQKFGGDANAALGIINRNGLGKIRHLDTGLLWIQQVVAEQRLKFGKVLGANNLADLFAKYLDEKTNLHHTTKFEFQAIEGRPADAPNLHDINVSIDAYVAGNNHNEWPWLCYLKKIEKEAKRTSTSIKHLGSLNVISAETHTTNVWQQVFWGSKQRVQGSNGLNAAQPSCLQGSI